MKIGLTFQQVQKYEKGTNRMGASRLQQIATILGVSPAYFFEGAPLVEGAAAVQSDEAVGNVVAFLSSAEGITLNRDFARISDPKVRRHICNLVSALAASESQADEPVVEAAEAA